MTSPTRRTSLLALVALGSLAFAPLPASAQTVVTIGYSGPLSGGAALYGKNVFEGLEMAVEEVNAAGLEVDGKPVQFKLEALDDQYNPSQTAINVQRLVQQDKAPVVVVPHSGGIFAVQTRNQAQNLLLIAHSSLPKITSSGNKLTIRIPGLYTNYMEPFVQYSMAKFGKKVGMAVTDSDYGKAWGKAFETAWKAAGGDVVINNPLSYNKSADFYSGVSKVLASKPDVMFIGGPSEPTGLVINQARELGFEGGFAIIDQAKFDEIAKITDGYAPMEGSVGVLPLVEDPNPDVKAFVERFKKRYAGKVPTYEQSMNYTAVFAIAEAMKLAGTTSDATKIRAQFDQAVKDLPTSANVHHAAGIDDEGGALLPPAVAIVADGKVVPRNP